MSRRGRESNRARIAAAACGALLAAAPAQAAWDMSSTAALNHTWTENSTYRTLGDNSDAISNLRLTGRIEAVSARSRFEASYSPLAIFYRDRSGLNRVSHLLTIRENLDLSARSSLSLSDSYYYSPEQGASPSAYNSPIVLTRYSDRTSNSANVAYNFQRSRVSRYVFDFRHQVLSYGNVGLADSTGYTFGARYDRDLSSKAGFECGINAGRTSFDRVQGSTEVDIVNAFIGGRIDAGRVVTLSGRIGENSVLPADPNRPTTTGLQAETSVQWSLRKAQAQIGYHQGINTGSGTFDASETKSLYGSLRWQLVRKLAADIYGNRSDSSNASSRTGSRNVRTFSGGARLDWAMTDAVSWLLGWTRNVQNSSVPNAPDLRFGTVSVGLLARFD